MDKLKLAEIIAKGAHCEQVDKAGVHYYFHPQMVASKVHTPTEKIVAWLHDVVEDTSVTLTELYDLGFSCEVVEAVDAITKREGENRKQYLERVKANDIARVVKLADLEHNSDLGRLPIIERKDFDRLDKYQQEIAFLQS